MPGPVKLADVLAKLRDAAAHEFRARDRENIFSEGILPVPVVALRDPQLSDLDLKLYATALRYATAPEPLALFASQDYLARFFDRSTRQVKRSLANLVKLGYLEVHPRAFGRRNVYLVALSVPPARLLELRAKTTGIAVDSPPPREGTYASPQTPVRGQNRPLGSTHKAVDVRSGPSAVVSTSPLKKKADAEIATGMPARAALQFVLAGWRQQLGELADVAAIAKHLAQLGLSRGIARRTARLYPLVAIRTAALHLDADTISWPAALVYFLKHPKEGQRRADRRRAKPEAAS